jgi:tetratricopeptide (TPR) repeat protein
MQMSMSLQGASTATLCALDSQSDATSTRRRVAQNFRLIWLDTNIDESDDGCRHSIAQLRRFVTTIDTFTDVDQCIDFLTEIKQEKVLMIMSSDLGQYLISLIHDVPQLTSVYVFCATEFLHEPWAEKWPKIQGIFRKIELICGSLRQATRRCDEDSVSVNFLSVSDTINQNLNEFDQSFMYTQILKEILLEMDYNEQSIIDMTAFWRSRYADNNSEMETIAKFEREYHLQSPIWWYTYSYFIYSTLNRALRFLEVDTIIKMGFFIRDLHQHIQQIHSEKSVDARESSILVYRGQGLSKADFEKMRRTKGGLMSFNNFLSTSKDRNVAYFFADSNQSNLELIGILFEITIDISMSLVPFATIDNNSNYLFENEILFSMHTIFRIGEITRIPHNERLWQVKLTLTNDNDPQLTALTERIRLETKGHVGWLRLIKLLNRLGQFSKAETICQLLLNQTTDDRVKAHLYHLLGSIKDDQGDYVQALRFMERALEIYQRTVPSKHPDFITAFNNIAGVYMKMGDHSKAFSYYEKLVEIRERILSSNHPDLAASYSNLGFMFFKKGEYSTAILYHEKALAIYQEALPANHPMLSTSYNNLAAIYNSTGEYMTTLSYLYVALDIDRKILPPNHPDLASVYNNIGWVYSNMQEYSRAIPFYERAIEIARNLLSENHPDVRTYIRNLESARKKS